MKKNICKVICAIIIFYVIIFWAIFDNDYGKEMYLNPDEFEYYQRIINSETNEVDFAEIFDFDWEK